MCEKKCEQDDCLFRQERIQLKISDTSEAPGMVFSWLFRTLHFTGNFQQVILYPQKRKYSTGEEEELEEDRAPFDGKQSYLDDEEEHSGDGSTNL